MPKRPVRLALLGIVLMAAAVRLWGLTTHSVWYDEAASLAFARLPLASLFGGVADPGNPPLYYLLLRGWVALFGSSEAGLRGLSALAGILAVPALFALARELFDDDRVALTGASILALLPMHVAYSQEARQYAVLTLVGILAAWSWAVALRTDRWRWWLLGGAAAGLGFWVHYTGALVPLFLGTHALLAARRLRAFAALGLCALVCAVPLTIYFAPSAGSYPFWQGNQGLGALLDLANATFGWVLPSGPTPAEVRYPLAAALLAAVFVPLALGALGALRAPVRRGLQMATCYFLAPLLFFLGVCAFKPVWHARYLLVALPGLVLTAAWVMQHAPRLAKLSLIPLWAFLTLFGLATSAVHWRNVDWRGAGAAAADVQRASGGGQGWILVTRPDQELPFAYYDQLAWPRQGYEQGQPPDCARLEALASQPGTTVVVQADGADGDPSLIVAHALARRHGGGGLKRLHRLRVFAFGPGAAASGFVPIAAADVLAEANPCR
ncbi:MAG TPA: glycosyltransferase family 39 protein [Myxococcales bacterium]|jgi:uncharacterized membrane protein